MLNMLNMLNITLTWFHNYMKPQNNTKRYKIKCSWEKYAPSALKGQKKCGLPYFFYIKKYFSLV